MEMTGRAIRHLRAPGRVPVSLECYRVDPPTVINTYVLLSHGLYFIDTARLAGWFLRRDPIHMPAPLGGGSTYRPLAGINGTTLDELPGGTGNDELPYRAFAAVAGEGEGGTRPHPADIRCRFDPWVVGVRLGGTVGGADGSSVWYLHPLSTGEDGNLTPGCAIYGNPAPRHRSENATVTCADRTELRLHPLRDLFFLRMGCGASTQRGAGSCPTAVTWRNAELKAATTLRNRGQPPEGNGQ
eukprot:gene13837-biopygen5057